MGKLALAILAPLVGTTILAGAVSMKSEQVIKNAVAVTAQANVHQLATALELYYSDNNFYPSVEGGPALVNTLEQSGYIASEPLDPKVFSYQVESDGQKYRLSIVP